MSSLPLIEIAGATAGTGGTVTSVTGTTNQIDVATGTTTPVISLDNAIILPGTLNKITFTAPTTAGTLAFGTDNSTLTLQGTGTVVNRNSTDTFTNKTFDTAGTGNSFSINGVAATANTGTGSVVRATTPTLVTPVLGVATATSINGTLVPTTTTGSCGVNLYSEGTSAGVTTNSNTTAVNMFTGYSLPANTLTAGHRLHIKCAFKHTTGATTTVYGLVFGAVTTSMFATSTGAGLTVVELDILAIDATHQQEIQGPIANPGGTLTVGQQNALTQTLNSGSLAINISQTAAGGSDVYTAYYLTVDLI